METPETCRSLGIVPADVPFVLIRPVLWPEPALPHMDFCDMHHNGCVMMGWGGNGGTVAYNHCLADEEPERPSHVFVGGEDMNSAHSPDSVVAVVGIKTGI